MASGETHENTEERRRKRMALGKIPMVNMALAETPTVNMGSYSSSNFVNVAVVQAATVYDDIPATLGKVERLLAQAASNDTQLLVFPEAFIGGYPHGSTSAHLNQHVSAINVPGPEVKRLAEMAGNSKVYLVMGVIERDGYTLYSTVLFFNSSGDYLGKHRKIMLTDTEQLIWDDGDGSTLPVFDTPIGKIGAAISGENRMPLLRTAMYAKGIEIYCAPTAGVWRDVGEKYMTNAALEGGCFVLSANQISRRRDYPPGYVFSGTEGNLTPDSVVCAGGSMIISPSGVVLVGPCYNEEVVLCATIDKRAIAAAKVDFDVVGKHARRDVFSLFIRDHPMRSVRFTSTSTRPEAESPPK